MRIYEIFEGNHNDPDHKRRLATAHKKIEQEYGGYLSPKERAKRRRNKEILQHRSQERIERIRAGLPGANPEWSKDDPFSLNDLIPNIPDDPARVGDPDDRYRKRR
jgi:hypothetical protein